MFLSEVKAKYIAAKTQNRAGREKRIYTSVLAYIFIRCLWKDVHKTTLVDCRKKSLGCWRQK